VATLLEDVLGARTRKASPQLRHVIDKIIERGRGVILYLPSNETIAEELAAATNGGKPAPRDERGVLREYGIGAQILLDLGVRKLQVISNNPRKLVGLEAWGFEATSQIGIEEV
jgi:3,4-dihydroxy 2-butanone 4-phosphate synthase/GTP cyclohydrolase II